MTHESQQGIINNPPEKNSHEWEVTHEAIYREHMIVLEQIRQFTEELNQRRKQNSV